MKRIVLIILWLGVFMLGSSSGRANNLQKAIFAGGCFWCMQPSYDKIPGVVTTTVGYTGGRTANPTYEEVSSGSTGHVEAILVVYDPGKTEYRELLRIFWMSIDPTDAGGQFADQGSQYEAVIYYQDEAQRLAAEDSKRELQSSGRFRKPIVTRILPAQPFYPAEDYHQKYYKKNADHYDAYKEGSGRADFLRKVWPR